MYMYHVLMYLQVDLDLSLCTGSMQRPNLGFGAPSDLGFWVPQTEYAIAILHATSGRIISNFGGVLVPCTEPSFITQTSIVKSPPPSSPKFGGLEVARAN